MIVICNYPGGINLGKIRLKRGENAVDRNQFTDTLAKIDRFRNPDKPSFSESLRTVMPDSSKPYLDWPGAPEVRLAPEPAQHLRPPADQTSDPVPEAMAGDVDASTPKPMSAKEKIAIISRADSIDTLKALARGETRPTVVEALDRRHAELEAK